MLYQNLYVCYSVIFTVAVHSISKAHMFTSVFCSRCFKAFPNRPKRIRVSGITQYLLHGLYGVASSPCRNFRLLSGWRGITRWRMQKFAAGFRNWRSKLLARCSIKKLLDILKFMIVVAIYKTLKMNANSCSIYSVNAISL